MSLGGTGVVFSKWHVVVVVAFEFLGITGITCGSNSTTRGILIIIVVVVIDIISVMDDTLQLFRITIVAVVVILIIIVIVVVMVVIVIIAWDILRLR